MSFSQIGLCNDILYAIEKLFYTNPYPVQQQVIPAVLAGNDVLGIAQTGSGKTVSYALPILEMLYHKKKGKNRCVNTLILVPTRELAIQVEKVIKQITSHMEQQIKCLAVFGGVSINPQMIGMQGVEVLIATPGRLLELVENNAVFLSEVEVLVIDEADKMLNLGFKAEMEKVLALLPPKRQNLLFSATLSSNMEGLENVLLKNPVKIEIPVQNHAQITQLAYAANDHKKGPLLRYLIKKHQMEQVLVFTSSVHRADAVVDKLVANGFNAVAMHSKLSQGARQNALTAFKSGETAVLVATDLMSRGIDIPFLPFVVNYELPRSPKDYVHRIGRTGRAENSGVAISLVNDTEKHHFEVIQKKMKQQIDLLPIDDLGL